MQDFPPSRSGSQNYGTTPQQYSTQSNAYSGNEWLGQGTLGQFPRNSYPQDGASSSQQTQRPGLAADIGGWEEHERGIGGKLMTKMGWKGKGLGKREEGLMVPPGIDNNYIRKPIGLGHSGRTSARNTTPPSNDYSLFAHGGQSFMMDDFDEVEPQGWMRQQMVLGQGQAEPQAMQPRMVMEAEAHGGPVKPQWNEALSKNLLLHVWQTHFGGKPLPPFEHSGGPPSSASFAAQIVLPPPSEWLPGVPLQVQSSYIVGVGKGPTKKAAEKMAANDACVKLNSLGLLKVPKAFMDEPDTSSPMQYTQPTQPAQSAQPTTPTKEVQSILQRIFSLSPSDQLIIYNVLSEMMRPEEKMQRQTPYGPVSHLWAESMRR